MIKKKKTKIKTSIEKSPKHYLSPEKWTEYFNPNYPDSVEILIKISLFNSYLNTPKKIKCETLQKEINKHIKIGDNINDENFKITIVTALATKERLSSNSFFLKERIEFIKKCAEPLNLDDTIIDKIIQRANNIETYIQKETKEKYSESLKTTIYSLT